MKPQLLRFGERQSPVVIVDSFSGDVGALVEIAAALAPFPPVADTYYPGLRRTIAEADRAANDYVERALQDAAPFIGGAFGFDEFRLVDASFSMVTARSDTLRAEQRAPHFDSTSPARLALLHYLSDTPNTGTAFYRQRATGIEIVDEGNVDAFVDAARRDRAKWAGYIDGSNASYEQIGAVEAIADRLIIYRSALLHSGIIRPGANLSADPRLGRLTANFFIEGA